MTEGTTAPPRRPPARRSDRLHTVGAGAVAVLAVLAGILVVNLLNGPSDPDDRTPVAAPTRPAVDGRVPADESTRPTPTRSPAPTPRRTPTAAPTQRPASSPPSKPAATVTPAPTRSAAATVAPPPPPPDRPARPTAPVVVLNNSRIGGLAEVAAQRVEAAGFAVERVGNYQSIYNVPVSTVFYDDEDAEAARTLLDAVPGIERMVPRSQTRIVSTDTLILVITRDFPGDS